MKKSLKNLYRFIGSLVDTIVSMLTIPLFSSFVAARELVNLKSDQKRNAFVLGNGPSLKDILISNERVSEITSGDSIVMNNFANSEFFPVIKPSYYVLLDPSFYDEETIQNREDHQLLYRNLHLVEWDMTLFLLYGANWRMVKKHINNPKIQIRLFNGTKILGFEWFQNLSYLWNLGLPSSRNVVIPALQLMINMGYQNVVLYGAEFSWTKTIDVDPRNNKVYLNNKHFYSDKEIHYYEKGWYKWYLEAIIDMLNGMEQLSKYAKSRKVKVVNRTKGSFVDSFEYVNPDIL